MLYFLYVIIYPVYDVMFSRPLRQIHFLLLLLLCKCDLAGYEMEILGYATR